MAAVIALPNAAPYTVIQGELEMAVDVICPAHRRQIAALPRSAQVFLSGYLFRAIEKELAELRSRAIAEA